MSFITCKIEAIKRYSDYCVVMCSTGLYLVNTHTYMYGMIHDNIGKIVILDTFMTKHVNLINSEHSTYRQIHNIIVCPPIDIFQFRRESQL